MPYNANAKARIDDLIKQAKSEKDIFVANEILLEARYILDNEFNPYPLDPLEIRTSRIENKIEIYEQILIAYAGIISKLPPENDFLKYCEDLNRIG